MEEVIYQNPSQQQSQYSKPTEPLQEVIIRKVGILSSAIISGILSFFIGIIFLIYGLIVFFMQGDTFSSVPGDSFTLNIVTLIFIPIIFAALGLVLGAVFGLLYNLSAKIGKGIKIYS